MEVMPSKYKPVRKRTIDEEGYTFVRGRGKLMKTATANTTITVPTTTSNSFAAIQPTIDSDASRTTEPADNSSNKIEHKPPPIIINRNDYHPSYILDHIKQILSEKYSIKANPTQVRVYAEDFETYDKITAFFKHPDTQVPYYTYAPRGKKKNKKYVILGLDKDFPLDDVIQAVDHKDLIDVRRITHSEADGSKTTKDTILVTFNPNYDPKDYIFKLTSIDRIKVRVRVYKPPKTPPQCYRCQAIGHTRNHCNLPQMCVRCSGPHDTKLCSKEIPLKCGNCGELGHPASWTGCPYRINLQRQIEERRMKAQGPNYIPAPAPKTNAWTARSSARNSSRPPATDSAPYYPPLPDNTPTHTSSQPRYDPYATPPWVEDLKKMTTTLLNAVNLLVERLCKN